MERTGPRLVELAPLGQITTMGLLLIASLLLVAAGVVDVRFAAPLSKRMPHGAADTCAPTSSMQYTSSSFAQMLVGLFGWVLRPRIARAKRICRCSRGQAEFHSDVPDAVLDEAVLPTFRFGAWLFSWFRVLQQGNVQIYLLYIFLALIALLLWR